MKKLLAILVAATLLFSCNKDRKMKDYRIEITADNIKDLEYESYEEYTAKYLSHNKPSFTHSWTGKNRNRIRVAATFDGTGTVTIYKEGKVIKTETSPQVISFTYEVEP